MAEKKQKRLSKREQQVMEMLFEKGPLAASDIQEGLPDPPSNSAVRSILRLLVEKGQAIREQDGFRYLYTPAMKRGQARRSAMKALLKTFFEGSPSKAFVELVDLSKEEMQNEDWEHLQSLVEKARQEGES